MLQQKTGMGSEPKWLDEEVLSMSMIETRTENCLRKDSGQDKIDRISDYV